MKGIKEQSDYMKQLMMKFRWSVSRADQHGSEVTAGKGTLRQKATERQKTPVGSRSHMCSKHRETCLWRRPYKEHFVSAVVPLPKQTLSFMECVLVGENGLNRALGHVSHPVVAVNTWRHATEPLRSTANGDQLRSAAIVFHPHNNDLQGFGTTSDILWVQTIGAQRVKNNVVSFSR